jgi:ribonuclease Z
VNFSLTILGSSSALPTSKRFPTAHLLNVNERFFLIDCGEGTQIQLRRYKAKFSRINHIFISHMHGDHLFGLFGLLSSFNLLGRKADLHIFGPSEMKTFIDFFITHFSHSSTYKIILHSTGHKKKQLIYENKNLEVYSFPLKHRIPTTGFLFVEKRAELNLNKLAIEKYKPGISALAGIKNGRDLELENGKIIPNKDLTLKKWRNRSYAFCSDTTFYPKIAEILKGVDILYHEATFSQADATLATETFHSTARQAAEIAKMAKVSKLLIGHYSNRYKDTDILLNEAKEVFENSFAVSEGEVYNVDRYRESD